MRLLFLILLIILSAAKSTAGHASDQNTSIRVGIDLWPGYYPIIIAQQLDLFKKHQLTVEYVVPENTDAMLQQFQAGGLDAICVAVGDVFSLIDTAPGMKIALVADLSAGGDALLSLEKSANALAGSRIGTNLGGFGELFVEQFLLDYQTEPQQVTLVDIDAANAVNALRSGQIDIVHTWEPYVTQATSQGARIIYTSRQTPGLIPDIVAFNGSILEANPAAVKSFVHAWLEAVEWWENNPEEGNAIISTHLPQAGSVNLKGIKLMSAEDNIDAFYNQRSPRALPKVVTRYIRFFQQKGIIKSEVSASQLIDGRFIPNSIPTTTSH